MCVSSLLWRALRLNFIWDWDLGPELHVHRQPNALQVEMQFSFRINFFNIIILCDANNKVIVYDALVLGLALARARKCKGEHRKSMSCCELQFGWKIDFIFFCVCVCALCVCFRSVAAAPVLMQGPFSGIFPAKLQFVPRQIQNGWIEGLNLVRFFSSHFSLFWRNLIYYYGCDGTMQTHAVAATCAEGHNWILIHKK